MFLRIHIVFDSFFMIPVVKEKARGKLILAKHTGTPITSLNEIIDISWLVADKAIKVLSK